LTVAAVVTLNGIVLTFINIFQCRPITDAFTDADNKAVKCVDIVTLYLCSAPVNIVTDIAILLLPLPMVTALRMNIRQKTGLVATFITWLFVTIVGVIRVVYLQEALIQEWTLKGTIGRVGNLSGTIPDFSWHASYSLMWSAVEVNVGLICACALVIKPLLVMIIPGTSRVGSTGQQVTIRPVPTSPRQADGLNHECPRHISGEYHDGVSTHMAHTIPPAGPHLEQFMSSTTNRHYMYPVDENREMDIRDFFNTADALVERAAPQDPRLAPQFDATIECSTPSVACSPIQEPKTFMDFVNIGDRKPLTELTKREAWWPIALGKSMRTVDNGHAR
jgi:hypothetical protein